MKRKEAKTTLQPEDASGSLLDSDDGRWVFESIFAAPNTKTVAQAG